MANLIVSQVCNAACGYCFASAHLAAARNVAFPAFMPLDEFESALDFLDRSEITEARILGGEPTLHPEFSALVRMASDRGKHVTVFTHGLLSEGALQSLLRLPVEACTVVVNLSAVFPGASDSTYAVEKRLRVIQTLGQRAQLGVNIQAPDFDLSAAVRMANEAGARSVVRLGMALPGPRGSNRFIHPKQYRSIGARLVRQAALAAREGIRLDLDCGFVRCMFTDAELVELKQNGVSYGWHCNPVLDICPGGTVLHCFSLSDRFAQNLSPTATATSLRATFDARLQGYRAAGVFPECSTCAYKANRECSGGCLSATLRRFQPAAFRVEIPENHPHGEALSLEQ